MILASTLCFFWSTLFWISAFYLIDTTVADLVVRWTSVIVRASIAIINLYECFVDWVEALIQHPALLHLPLLQEVVGGAVFVVRELIALIRALAAQHDEIAQQLNRD